MSVREAFGMVIGGILSGIGFATLFIHFVAGGCIP